MKNIFTPLVAVSFLLYSCGNNTNDKPTKHSELTVQNEHHHDDKSEAIELNNGEKWKVDSNMLVHIRNMENDIVSFLKEERKDFKSLGEKLKSNIDLLTSNCTMKGKAHDELHKWLLPFIELSEKFTIAPNKEEQEKIYQEFKKSFIEFNTYFE